MLTPSSTARAGSSCLAIGTRESGGWSNNRTGITGARQLDTGRRPTENGRALDLPSRRHRQDAVDRRIRLCARRSGLDVPATGAGPLSDTPLGFPPPFSSEGHGMNLPRVAVVIPAYRAEKLIGRVLAQIPSFVEMIVVVEDKSPDNTAEIVTRCAVADPRIHLVRHAINQGVGGAMLTGYAAAIDPGAEVIVKMDSD